MSGTLRVTMVRSLIGNPEKHRKIMRHLGLTKINRSVDYRDTPSIRGMVRKVAHLVRAEEINNETA